MAQAVIKRGIKDERWEVIEILYGTAALAGLPPLKLISHELDIPECTAAYWVQGARAAGWLAGLTSNLGRPASERPDPRDTRQRLSMSILRTDTDTSPAVVALDH